MSFHTKLINLLKTDPRFGDDEGELVLENGVIGENLSII